MEQQTHVRPCPRSGLPDTEASGLVALRPASWRRGSSGCRALVCKREDTLHAVTGREPAGRCLEQGAVSTSTLTAWQPEEGWTCGFPTVTAFPTEPLVSESEVGVLPAPLLGGSHQAQSCA